MQQRLDRKLQLAKLSNQQRRVTSASSWSSSTSESGSSSDEVCDSGHPLFAYRGIDVWATSVPVPPALNEADVVSVVSSTQPVAASVDVLPKPTAALPAPAAEPAGDDSSFTRLHRATKPLAPGPSPAIRTVVFRTGAVATTPESRWRPVSHAATEWASRNSGDDRTLPLDEYNGRYGRATNRHVDPWVASLTESDGDTHVEQLHYIGRRTTSPALVRIEDAQVVAVDTCSQQSGESNAHLRQIERTMRGASKEAADGIGCQTESSVKAALSVARQLLRCTADTQTDGYARRAPAGLSTASDTVMSPGTLRRVLNAAVQCDAVAQATCAIATDAQPTRVAVSTLTDHVAAVNVGTETWQTPQRTQAIGTDTDLLEQLQLRDATPSPARRSPPPGPIPMSSPPPASASVRRRDPVYHPHGRAVHQTSIHKDVFNRCITPLGRKTPPRELHHVNSPMSPQQRKRSPVRRMVEHATPALQKDDKAIAVKAVQFVLFSEYSRSSEFRNRLGYSLREVRTLHDIMLDDVSVWGYVGAYACFAPEAAPTNIDLLMVGALREVAVAGACRDWTSWFPGVSRRRAQDAFYRFSSDAYSSASMDHTTTPRQDLLPSPVHLETSHHPISNATVMSILY